MKNVGYLRSLLIFFLLSMKDSEENKDKKETAAVKIQAAFRGHMAREDVKKIRTSKAEEETEGDN